MQTPLVSVGEAMGQPRIEDVRIPTLTGKTHVSDNGKQTIMSGINVTNYHKIVFLLVKEKHVMHVDDIARKTDIPKATAYTALRILANHNVLISPERACYTLAGNFLKAFQLQFGSRKLETLTMMFDEAGIDISDFQPSVVSTSNIETDTEEDLTCVLNKLLEIKRQKLTQINSDIGTHAKALKDLEEKRASLELELEPFNVFATATTGIKDLSQHRPC